MTKIYSTHRMMRKRLAKAIVEKGNSVKGYQALHPGVPYQSAKKLVKERLRHPEVQENIRELLDKQGITVARLNRKLKDIIEDPSKEVMTKRGEVVKLADKPTQLSALSLGYKLHGITDGNNDVTFQDNRSITFNASGVPQEEISRRLMNIFKRLDKMGQQVDEEKYITGEIATDNAI